METPTELETKLDIKEDSRERLMRSALKFFANKGIAGSTVREIAEDAGVNVSLVSYYFQGKEGLYRACIEEYGNSRSQVARAILLQKVESVEEFRIRLQLLLESMIEFQNTNPYPCQILMREIDEGLPNARDIFEQTLLKNIGLLVDFVKMAQDKGIVKASVDPMIFTLYLQGSVFHLSRTDNVRKQFFGQSIQEPAVRQHHIDQMLDLFLNGVLTTEKKS